MINKLYITDVKKEVGLQLGNHRVDALRIEDVGLQHGFICFCAFVPFLIKWKYSWCHGHADGISNLYKESGMG